MADAAVELLRRLPPDAVVDNLGLILAEQPDLAEDLLSRVDQPLRVAHDGAAGRDYLLCDYNRDADSYRSPWSSAYDPPLEDGAVPPPELRTLEVAANEVFNAYRAAYYEGGTSSVYLWQVEGAPAGAFAAAFLVHKGEGSARHGGGVERGCWDAVHVAEVAPGAPGAPSAYSLTSTVTLSLALRSPPPAEAAAAPPLALAGEGSLRLAGSLTRTATASALAASGEQHLVQLGKLVEESENKLRAALDAVYFGRTRAVLAGLRTPDGGAGEGRAPPQTALVTDMLAKAAVSGPPPGGMALPGMAGPGGLGAGFNPLAELAKMRAKKAAAAAPAGA